MRKRVHEYVGIGYIETGGPPESVRYNINEYREMIPVGNMDEPDATIERQGGFEGTIRTLDGSPWPFKRSDLMLSLADGKKLMIIVTESHGERAEVRGSGALLH